MALEEDSNVLKDTKIINRLAKVAVDKATRYTEKLKAKKELDRQRKSEKPEVDIKVRKLAGSRKSSIES